MNTLNIPAFGKDTLTSTLEIATKPPCIWGGRYQITKLLRRTNYERGKRINRKKADFCEVC